MAAAPFQSTREVVLRTPEFARAVEFYETVLALPVAYRDLTIVGFETGAIRLYVEEGSAHAPVFELLVADVRAAKAALLAAGCAVVEDNPAVPRLYLRDPFGFTFNLGTLKAATVARPNLAARPWQLSTGRAMAAPPAALYRAFTVGLERWFAAPGSLKLEPRVGAPFYWETEHTGERHPHYGRLLTLEPDRQVELTWLTGATLGAETVLSVSFVPAGRGTTLELSHAGFPDQASMQQHAEAWPYVLEQLDTTVGAG